MTTTETESRKSLGASSGLPRSPDREIMQQRRTKSIVTIHPILRRRFLRSRYIPPYYGHSQALVDAYLRSQKLSGLSKYHGERPVAFTAKERRYKRKVGMKMADCFRPMADHNYGVGLSSCPSPDMSKSKAKLTAIITVLETMVLALESMVLLT